MKIKILLAENDADWLAATAHALEREGFEVVTATDGMQALERYQADRPDMVVLEADLPHSSGFEVCRQIRETGSTPVIMLSVVTAKEQISQSFRSGADDYIIKPVNPRQLATRIDAVWRRTAVFRESQEVRSRGCEMSSGWRNAARRDKRSCHRS